MGGRCAVAAAVAVWLGLVLGARLDAHAALLALTPLLPLAWLARRAPDRVGTVALLLALTLAAIARGAAGRAALAHGPKALGDDPGRGWRAAAGPPRGRAPRRRGGGGRSRQCSTTGSDPTPASW